MAKTKTFADRLGIVLDPKIRSNGKRENIVSNLILPTNRKILSVSLGSDPIRDHGFAVRVARTAVHLAGPIAGLFLLLAIANSYRAPSVYRKDFLQDYVIAKATANGTDPYATLTALTLQYAPEALPSMEHPSPHPPTTALLLLPFALVPAEVAAESWLVVELASLIATIAILARFVGAKPRPMTVLVLAASSILWYPVFEELGAGQLTFAILALSAGGQLALDRRRSVAGGILFGLALLMKPVLWIVIPFLAYRRDWRGLGATTGVVAAGYLAAAVVIGPDRVVGYFLRVLPLVTTIYRATSRNLSLWSVGWRIFDGTPGSIRGYPFPTGVDAPPLIAWSAAAPIAAAILPLVALAIAAAALRRRRDVVDDLGIVVCASLPVSPTTWGFYLVLLALPLATIVRRLARGRKALSEYALLTSILVVTGIPDAVIVSFVSALSGSTYDGNSLNLVAAGPSLLTLIPALGIIGVAAMTARQATRSPGPDVPRASAVPIPRPAGTASPSPHYWEAPG